MSTTNGKARVVAHFGSQRALARALGISVQAVSKWKQIPHGRVERVARLTGIPAEELRPDLAALFRQPRRPAA